MQKGNVLKNIVRVTVLSIAVAIGLNCLLLFIDLARYSERYQEAMKVLWAPRIWHQILYSGICIPIVEEIIFRGILYRVIRRWFSFLWATVISALAFGIYHGNLVQFVYAGFCGLLLAYLYEKYQSILVAIWAHMVMNLVAIVLTQFRVFSWVTENFVVAFFVTILCALIVVYHVNKLHKLDVTKVLNIYCKEKSNDI